MSAQAEICSAPPAEVETARLSVLNRLYELRYQTADLAQAAAHCHDLVVSLKAHLAHSEILAAIDAMERTHPELV